MKEVKANIPANAAEYERGNGEGVFVAIDGETLEAYNENKTGGEYIGSLDNDSWNYPGLTHGTTIPLEMRGENRPVVPLQWLIENYGPEAENA